MTLLKERGLCKAHKDFPSWGEYPLVKCLPCKHKDLVQMPSTHIKLGVVMCMYL